MRIQNKHDWSALFAGNICRICYNPITSGTAKAEHAKKHVRENLAYLIGQGTVENPFQYIQIYG